MKLKLKPIFYLVVFLLTIFFSVEIYASNYLIGDPLPDAPDLAYRGDYRVGVRTLEIVNENQIDILNYSKDNPDPRYDRKLKLEVWYPAEIPERRKELTTYLDYQFGDYPEEPIVYQGRALRNAPVHKEDSGYPLVIVSHGYPGTRLMMSYLTENLASKGYVVVAIDHTDSTSIDQKAFSSTLLNRPLDILFTLDKIAEMGREDSDSFLAGMVDADHTALIGYSMGGYGSINAAGAGFSENAVNLPWGVPGGHLKIRQSGQEIFEKSIDKRIKAIFVMAPWGASQFWDKETMKGLKVPSFYVVGDEDDVAGYENGVKLFYDWAVNSERYMLVFRNARHNIAPNAYDSSGALNSVEMTASELMRFNEPSWDNRHINNIIQHFATAFLGIYLKGENYQDYLDLIPISNEGKWSQDKNGNFKDDHTHWKGFPERTAIGLEFYHSSPDNGLK